MVDAVDIANNQVRVIQNDDISFDTARPSITLFPESSRLIVNAQEVLFPSFLQGTAYFRGAKGQGSICEYWSTLFWQEWGPGFATHNELYYPNNPGASIPGPTTRNLPVITLGSVPANANHLDIRAKLTRTAAPPAFLGVQPINPFFPLNEWINLTSGGSCPVEAHYPMARHFDIRRVGNSIELQRYQSVHNTNSANNVGPGGWPNRNISVNQSGWNWQSKYKNSDGSDLNTLFPKSNQNIVYLMSSKGPEPLGQNRRPGSGQDECAFSTFYDMTSRYLLDLIITPGLRK